jgi:hypothetical protein
MMRVVVDILFLLREFYFGGGRRERSSTMSIRGSRSSNVLGKQTP